MKRSFLRSTSSKRAKQMPEYSKLKKKFLAENPSCAVFPRLRATDVHHTNGRHGARLSVVKWWKPVSRRGHRYIHDNPKWARDNGFFINEPLPTIFDPQPE